MTNNNIDLDDLLGNEITTATDQEQTILSGELEIDINLIYPDPNQPRKIFDEEKLLELAESIKENGLVQAITIKDDGTGKYIIIAGERRYRAHLLAGLEKIKVNITDYKEVTSEVQLIENIQREDLSPFEIALSIKEIWEQGKYTKKSDLAKKIGKPATYVSKAFAVFNLCDEIIDHLKSNHSDIGLDILQEISREPNPEEQLYYYNQYSAGEITREDIRKRVKWSLDNLEEEKEKLDNEAYSKILKEDILSGTASVWLCEYPTGKERAQVTIEKNDLNFRHKNDFLKIKEWKKIYTENEKTRDKEESEREKLNDETFAKEVKQLIFSGSHTPSDGSYIWINNKCISFGNVNDTKKIKEWKEAYTKAQEEKQKSFTPLEDCKKMDSDKLKEEIIELEERIILGEISVDDFYVYNITNILEEKLKGTQEDSFSTEAKIEGLIRNGFIISKNKRFIFTSAYDDVVFFTNEEQKKVFIPLQIKNDFEENIENMNSNGRDEILIENDVFTASNLSIIDNSILLQFSDLLLNEKDKEELFQDIRNLREKYQKSFEERKEKVL